MMTHESSVSDAPNCGIIYPCNWWQANDKARAKTFIVQASLMIVTYDCQNIVMVQDIGESHWHWGFKIAKCFISNVSFKEGNKQKETKFETKKMKI